MTTEQKIIRAKVGLLELANEFATGFAAPPDFLEMPLSDSLVQL